MLVDEVLCDHDLKVVREDMMSDRFRETGDRRRCDRHSRN